MSYMSRSVVNPLTKYDTLLDDNSGKETNNGILLDVIVYFDK